MGAEQPENGLVTLPGRPPVEAMLRRLERALQARGITIFAVIDHSGEAEKVGLRMPNTKLIIFGNPKGGTPLMIAAPTLAIDLPMKILLWEDAEGKAWVTYNHPEFLRNRHHLPPAMVGVLAAVAKIAEEIVQ